MIKKLQKALRENQGDDSIYYAWQSNIAMAFKDEYWRARQKKKYINRDDLHLIANNAAKNFLDILIGEEDKVKKGV